MNHCSFFNATLQRKGVCPDTGHLPDTRHLDPLHLIRTDNPDILFCIDLRAFGPPPICVGSRYPEMSGVLSSRFIGFLKERLLPKVLQVIIQIVVVCRERVSSLHLVIFEKGSMRPFIKRFYKLSSRIFMGFYF
jgi:hypothetical protein